MRRDTFVYPDTRPANVRSKNKRRGRNNDEKELSDHGSVEWTL